MEGFYLGLYCEDCYAEEVGGLLDNLLYIRKPPNLHIKLLQNLLNLLKLLQSHLIQINLRTPNIIPIRIANLPSDLVSNIKIIIGQIVDIRRIHLILMKLAIADYVTFGVFEQFDYGGMEGVICYYEFGGALQ